MFTICVLYFASLTSPEPLRQECRQVSNSVMSQGIQTCVTTQVGEMVECTSTYKNYFTFALTIKRYITTVS